MTAVKGADPKKFEYFVDRCSVKAEQSDVYVLDKILDVRVHAGEVEYKVKWRGCTTRAATWEPSDNLIAHGAEESVREWHTKNKDRKDPLKLVYMVMMIEAEMSETEKTVQHLMKRHKLEGKLKEWAAPYCEELEKVLSTRCEELFGDDYVRAQKEEKIVPLRMNPEPKKGGRKKMRLLVKGFLEPTEWDGKTDSPTVMSSTIRQLIAMGAPLKIVDGDLYVDMDTEGPDEDDDVISVGDIRTASFLFGKEYGPYERPIGMYHTSHTLRHTQGCSG